MARQVYNNHTLREKTERNSCVRKLLKAVSPCMRLVAYVCLHLRTSLWVHNNTIDLELSLNNHVQYDLTICLSLSLFRFVRCGAGFSG